MKRVLLAAALLMGAMVSALREYYRAQGKYIAVPSLGTIDEVFERIATEIEKLA